MFALVLNIFTFIITVIVNAYSNILPLNNQTTGEVSNKLDVLVTPPGYVFSIWTVIYLLCGIWIIRQIPASRRHLDVYRKSSFFFIMSNLLNAAWLFLWHYEQFFASVIVMAALLITLIALYTSIQRTRHTLMDILPFSIYTGWISVAAIVNISYYLKYIGWGGFGLSDQLWTVIVLILGAALALLFRYVNRDWFYPLVFIWAFTGIGYRNWEEHAFVSYAAFALSAVILAAIPLLRKKKKSIW